MTFYSKALPALLADFYKFSHADQYPEGTEVVYSTWTPRASRIENEDSVVVYGPQFAVQMLEELFQENFFKRKWKDIEAEYTRFLKGTLGIEEPNIKRIKALYKLKHLPLRFSSLPEGTSVPLRVPFMTVENTAPGFYWLTNFLETLLSCEMWPLATSATIARGFRRTLDACAERSSDQLGAVDFQCHDFSMRGMSSWGSAAGSGSGHLLSFKGTDTAPAILFLEHYYGADIEKETVGCSIPATEHSVMCANGQDEYEVIKRLITETYPTGPISIVIDTWDYWNVVGKVLPRLKDEIMGRDGTLVIRPDSGDPVKIVTGDPDAPEGTLARNGTMDALWDIFGGKFNSKGYRELDSHIGLIYGDAITYERARQIAFKLIAKKYASTNVVFGVGSYTYQYNTRDTLGFAMKSTYVEINGKPQMIYKDPKTDDGTKKSQRGRVSVVRDEDAQLVLKDGLLEDDPNSLLKVIWENGEWKVRTNLAEIRKRLERKRRRIS